VTDRSPAAGWDPWSAPHQAVRPQAPPRRRGAGPGERSVGSSDRAPVSLAATRLRGNIVLRAAACSQGQRCAGTRTRQAAGNSLVSGRAGHAVLGRVMGSTRWQLAAAGLSRGTSAADRKWLHSSSSHIGRVRSGAPLCGAARQTGRFGAMARQGRSVSRPHNLRLCGLGAHQRLTCRAGHRRWGSRLPVGRPIQDS